MKNRISIIVLSLFMLPLIGTAQTFSMNATGDPLVYEFDVTGLEKLDDIPDRTARWELFIETGDGYYIRRDLDNPANKEIVFTISHTYSYRVPDPADITMTATPIYSPNKKPVILGNSSSPPAFGEMGALPTDYPNFLSESEIVKIDLNWSVLEAEDRFTVIGGYRPVSSQNKVDLSQGGVLSIYYNTDLVEYLPGTGYRSYDNISESTANYENDEVYQDYEGAFDAHIDFVFPPDSTSVTGAFPVPQFVYASFRIKSPEEVGETNAFEIAAVVRENSGTTAPPASNYEISKMEGQLQYGKDPNSINGIPDTICFPNNTLTHLRYHVEFFNEGNASVDSAKMEIILPEHIKLEDGPLNMSLIEARWGAEENLPLQYFHYHVTATSNPTGPDKVLIVIDSVKDLSNEHNSRLSLFGFKEEYLLNFPDYYSKCSAEFLFEFERDMTLNTCDPDNPIAAQLEIEFPSGDKVTASDTIACYCVAGPKGGGNTAEAFPCNIVPQVSFLGGCWCTLLVILFLLIILFLIIVIWRNSNS